LSLFSCHPRWGVRRGAFCQVWAFGVLGVYNQDLMWVTLGLNIGLLNLWIWILSGLLLIFRRSGRFLCVWVAWIICLPCGIQIEKFVWPASIFIFDYFTTRVLVNFGIFFSLFIQFLLKKWLITLRLL
jgi:hypothetical protein